MKKHLAFLAGTILLLGLTLSREEQARMAFRHCMTIPFFVFLAFMLVCGGGMIGGAYGKNGAGAVKVFFLFFGASDVAVMFLAITTKNSYQGDSIPFFSVRIMLATIVEYLGWLLPVLADERDALRYKKYKEGLRQKNA